MLSLSHLGYDSSGFSWIIESDRTNVVQTMYQLQVSLHQDFTSSFYDTGEISSCSSVCVPAVGLDLPSSETVYWRVKVWDNHDEDSGWSDPQVIITNPNQKEWKAKFITPETSEDASLAKGKLLRKEFDIDSEITRATVYATALGIYELHINGQRVGDALLTPGWTEYEERLLYQTWDVTALLKKGKNAVGAVLGSGWYKGDLAGWLGRRNIYGDRNAFFMQLDIRYENDKKQVEITNDNWKHSDGPIIFSELYHGETYDAREEKHGWNTADYNDNSWTKAEVLDVDYKKLAPQDGQLVKRQDILPVKEIIVTPEGETVLDFGQNLVGWVRFTVSGKKGDTVKLRHAEVLDHNGNFYTANMRDARNEILYMLKGDKNEVFEPHFTFQGFRYVSVDEWPGTINPEDFKAVVIHSDMNRVGEFECSHELLNKLHHNILWGLKGNFVDIPTDCPQRDERLGWTGDAQVFARTSTYLMDTRTFFIKWLRDLRISQKESGAVPHVVPDILSGKFTEDDVNENVDSVSGWGDAAVICPWAMWLAYGDKKALGECYESMKAWVDFIRNRATDGLIWNTDFQLGDWVALDAKEGSYFGATATDLIATAYYAKSTEILAKTAEILGFYDDKVSYESLLKNIKDAYAKEFFSHTGRLVSPTQTAHILSLAFDMTPEDYKKRTIQGLLKLIEDNDGHLTTGFLGTPYFCQVLADNGCLKNAYDLLLKEDYPSWLYQITKGATTVWEHWDGIKPDGSMWSDKMNSFNHYAYGSVGEFLYRVVAGIDTDLERTGYKHIVIKPQPGGGITHTRAKVLTPYGDASIKWDIKNSVFSLNAVIPHNSSATITMPDGTKNDVGSGAYSFSCKIDQ